MRPPSSTLLRLAAGQGVAGPLRLARAANTGLASRIAPLAVVAVTTAGIYLFLTVLLRTFGRRQLGQLTVIDVVVVLLLGSAVETAMIHGNVSLTAGLVSAATLLVTNRALSWFLGSRPRLAHLVGGGPVLLVDQGEVVAAHLRRVGMTGHDLAAALRAHGYSDASEVRYATLETDGSVSVIPRT